MDIVINGRHFPFKYCIRRNEYTYHCSEAIRVPTLIAHTKMTSLPLTRRVSARLSASPALDLSASNLEAN